MGRCHLVSIEGFSVGGKATLELPTVPGRDTVLFPAGYRYGRYTGQKEPQKSEARCVHVPIIGGLRPRLKSCRGMVTI